MRVPSRALPPSSHTNVRECQESDGLFLPSFYKRILLRSCDDFPVGIGGSRDAQLSLPGDSEKGPCFGRSIRSEVEE